MTRTVRIGAIVAGALLAGIAALAVLAKVLITPERVKRAVIPVAEKALQRPVRLGNVEVSIFSGIVLWDVAVMEKNGTSPFLSAKAAKLSYRFWPLLKGRVVVNEVGIEEPKISVVRFPDGTFNYSDIIAARKAAAGQKPPAEKREIDLLISKVDVSGGNVLFEDRKVPEGRPPARYSVGDVELSSRDISLAGAFPVKARASVSGVRVEFDGKASGLEAQPALDGTVRIDADMKKTVAGLPPDLRAKAAPYDPEGAITAKLNLSGPLKAPKALFKGGEVKLDQFRFTLSGQRATLAGTILLKGDTLSSSGLVLNAGEQKLAIALSAANLFAKPVSIASTITSDRFDPAPFQKKPGAGGKEAAPRSEPGPHNLPVTATGTISIGRTAYRGVPVSAFTLKYRLKDNILVVEQLSGEVAGGKFSDTARIDLSKKGYSYSTRLTVSGVQADPLVAALAPKATGTLFGTLALNAELSGAGVRSAALQSSLKGTGDFTVANGRLTGAGLVQELARFVNLEQLRVLRFSTFAGTFRIANGRVLLDSSASGSDAKLAPRGTIGLDKSLDLALGLRVSPALTSRMARGDLGRFLSDDQGWGMLPVRVGGTTSSPSFRMDTAEAGGQLRKRAREELQQTIERKLLKKKEGEAKRPEQDLIERGLKGIFGR